MKIKLFLISVIITFFCLNAGAQEHKMWIGGSVGIWSSKVKGGDGSLSYKFAPEFGYRLSENLALGVSLGFLHSENRALSDLSVLDTGGREADGFTFEPYVRYSFLEGNFGFLMINGGVNYTRLKYKNNDTKEHIFGVGVTPGVGIKLSDRFTLTGQFGFFGYQNYKFGDHKQNDFGLDIDMDTFEVGVIFNF